MNSEKNYPEKKGKKIVVWIVVVAIIISFIAPVVAMFLGSS